MPDNAATPTRTSAMIERERLVMTAVFGRDKASMTRLMSPDGFGFDATMGLVSQQELIDGIDGLTPEARFEMDDVRVVFTGLKVAALAYRLRQFGSFAGVPLPEVVRCCSMWRFEGGTWRAVFHHETPAAPSDRDAGAV